MKHNKKYMTVQKYVCNRILCNVKWWNILIMIQEPKLLIDKMCHSEGTSLLCQLWVHYKFAPDIATSFCC